MAPPCACPALNAVAIPGSCGSLGLWSKQTGLGGRQAGTQDSQVSHLRPSNFSPPPPAPQHLQLSPQPLRPQRESFIVPTTESFLISVYNVSCTLHLTHCRIHHRLVASKMTPLLCLLHVLESKLQPKSFSSASYDTSFSTLSPAASPPPPPRAELPLVCGLQHPDRPAQPAEPSWGAKQVSQISSFGCDRCEGMSSST